MFNINNINGMAKPFGYNQGQNRASAPKTRTEQEAEKKAPAMDKIMFSAPAQQAAKSVELSEKAQNYLADLKERYGDYDFIIADYSTDEEAQKLLSRGDGEVNVLITPDLLEKMAADEDARAEYEAIIAGAESKFDQIKENLGDNAEIVKKLGFSVKEDGSVDFYALLIKGLKTKEKSPIITAGFAEELADKINAIAEKRKEQKEARAKEDKPSTMPPKSFEKYKKEENPYRTEEDYGTLPPESFKKYDKEESPYKAEEDYGTLPPESFKKYDKEESPYKTEEDYGTLPPESFKKYDKEESPYKAEEDYGTMPPRSFQKYLADDKVDENNLPPVSFTV